MEHLAPILNVSVSTDYGVPGPASPPFERAWRRPIWAPDREDGTVAEDRPVP